MTKLNIFLGKKEGWTGFFEGRRGCSKGWRGCSEGLQGALRAGGAALRADGAALRASEAALRADNISPSKLLLLEKSAAAGIFLVLAEGYSLWLQQWGPSDPAKKNSGNFV